MTDDGLMKVRDAAAYLSMSERSVWRLLRAGQVPYAKIGGATRIPRAALKALVEKNLIISSTLASELGGLTK